MRLISNGCECFKGSKNPMNEPTKAKYIAIGAIFWLLVLVLIIAVMQAFSNANQTTHTTNTQPALVKQWFVQVASFSDHQKLARLEKKLTKKHYQTNIVFSVDKNGKTQQSLRVGPYASLEIAKTNQRILVKSFKVSPQIITSHIARL